MASVGSIQLVNKTLTANEISAKKATELGQFDFVAMLKVSNYASGSIAGKIQHSPDGLTWFDLVSFTGLSGDGVEIQPITGPVLSNVRADLTAGEGDVICELRYDKRGK